MSRTGYRAYRRVRNRLGTWRDQRLAPSVLDLGIRLTGTTTAVLEYPFEPRARWGWEQPPHTGMAELLGRHEEDYRHKIDGLSRHLPYLAKIPRHPTPGQPAWMSAYWTGLDAIFQYATLVDRHPRTYVEVGSGNSTLFARQAIRDHSLSTVIVSIDPEPRADVDAACDVMQRQPLGRADLSVFDQLESGDVVLLDGTHIVFMNSDATVAFLDILPRLAKGVLVGIHDIFLPWDYPPEWTGRWYGEQYLLAALLLGHSPDWSVRFPAWYVSHHPDLAVRLEQVWEAIGELPDRTGSSMWLERV